MALAAWLEGSDLVLRLYIQPKASRDSLLGLHGDELKVAITAPPVDGKANAHLTKYLAKQTRRIVICAHYILSVVNFIGIVNIQSGQRCYFKALHLGSRFVCFMVIAL